MKYLVCLNSRSHVLLLIVLPLVVLSFSCRKEVPEPFPVLKPIVVMEGDYQKIQDDCHSDEPSYLLTITRDKPVKEDIVKRPEDGVIVIKNLLNSKKSRIYAEQIGESYRIPSQKTVLKGRSTEISGMVHKIDKTLTINYRLVNTQEPAMHCSSEFLDIH